MNIRIKHKVESKKTDNLTAKEAEQSNQCPKAKDGNCLVSGVFCDSDPIGGG